MRGALVWLGILLLLALLAYGVVASRDDDDKPTPGPTVAAVDPCRGIGDIDAWSGCMRAKYGAGWDDPAERGDGDEGCDPAPQGCV